jgi:uncharacterized protein (DUF1501 family)
MQTKQMAEDVNTTQNSSNLGKLAGSLLNKVDGPRVAMIETSGWDTHSAQESRLTKQLKSLDELIAALKLELDTNWQKTTVLVATEFGRTAAANGTGGTDHGTASVAMILGGDVQGGKVIADWPGLTQSQLFQARDLKPTSDLNSLITSTISTRYNLDADKVARTLFAMNKGYQHFKV